MKASPTVLSRDEIRELRQAHGLRIEWPPSKRFRRSKQERGDRGASRRKRQALLSLAAGDSRVVSNGPRVRAVVARDLIRERFCVPSI